jgi:hypothetical protein
MDKSEFERANVGRQTQVFYTSELNLNLDSKRIKSRHKGDVADTFFSAA